VRFGSTPTKEGSHTPPCSSLNSVSVRGHCCSGRLKTTTFLVCTSGNIAQRNDIFIDFLSKITEMLDDIAPMQG
jgi:hypothetical protein